ncbi:guanine deaminase [Enterobacter ludwigii]|uniref:guanine deaminase n=1 Tax=Enterobacteriaceae TaxID=543 RepID=UPI0029413D48|nr:guanine deaminase [Citrobacter amalonaticus]
MNYKLCTILLLTSPIVSAETTGYRGEILFFTGDPAKDKSAIAYYKDGYLIVKDGHIEKAGEYNTLKDIKVDDTIDYQGKIITPGFVDTHVHYPQIPMISEYGEQLIGWLNTYTFPTEIKYKDHKYASQEAGIFLEQLISNGTTTALVFATSSPISVDAFFEQTLKRNMRMISGKVLMDRNAPAELLDTPQSAYEDSKALIEKWQHKGRLDYAVTPRFAPTSTNEELQVVKRLLKEFPDVYLHTHLAENNQEVKWVKELFPDNRSYLDVYDKNGLVTHKSIFAHSIHLDEQDYKVLSEKGANIAFCPTSNLFLGSGLFNLDKAREHNITVGLGTDVGAGTSLSILQTMDEAYKVTQMRKAFTDNPETVNSLTPMENLYLATLGGATALSLQDKIGSFTPGKEADFVVLNPMQGQILKGRDENAKTIEETIFGIEMLGDDRTVEHTYVMGKKMK